MRRLLGTVLLLALLLGAAACGDDATTADDPAPTGPGSPTSSPTGSPTSSPTAEPSTGTPAGSLAFTEVALVSQTAAGGGSGAKPGVATVLDGPQSIGPFVDQFQQSPLTGDLMAAIDAADVPAGQVLAAAVLSVGCDVPPGIASVTREGGDLVLTPEKVASPLQECLAAVTTVGLVSLDASAL